MVRMIGEGFPPIGTDSIRKNPIQPQSVERGPTPEIGSLSASVGILRLLYLNKQMILGFER